LLSRRARSSPANASGWDTHRASKSRRFAGDAALGAGDEGGRRVPAEIGSAHGALYTITLRTREEMEWNRRGISVAAAVLVMINSDRLKVAAGQVRCLLGAETRGAAPGLPLVFERVAAAR
jgi:hypothetical protein